MAALDWAQALAFLALVLVLAGPLGSYMARVYQGRAPLLGRILSPFEALLYRLCGIRADEEMPWQRYAMAMLLFNAIGFVALYLLQLLQNYLPFNPQGLPAVTPMTAFNTAVSFVTNTNWQSYSGEQTMSYLTQALGLTVQNFVSAATGMAVVVALIRGLTRRSASTVGSFWVDVTRSVLYVLLPLSFVVAVVLVSQGVVQTWQPSREVGLLQSSGGASSQTLALGPVASQVAIKQLGTNGGGYFNANSAHPFENPTPLSNLLEMVAILLIPAALCYTYGEMVGSRRQGLAILAAMTCLLAPMLAVCLQAEQAGNPLLTALGVDQTASATQSGGNMEGKEARFGIVDSALWAASTTAASNGSVNAMHDSFTPLGGLAPMWLMQLGEVAFGGLGSGLYGMVVFAIVTVFISGLMVGRTPEYLGKKIEPFEMKMASLVILIPPILVLLGTGVALVLPAGRAAILNSGPHGLSEVLYAFSSAANNNGSAFAGLSAGSDFYNLALGLMMLVGRYWLMVPTLAIAGSLARKKVTPAGPGTLPTDTPLFVGLLVAVVIIVGALSFLPALALGPLVEHLQLALTL